MKLRSFGLDPVLQPCALPCEDMEAMYETYFSSLFFISSSPSSIGIATGAFSYLSAIVASAIVASIVLLLLRNRERHQCGARVNNERFETTYVSCQPTKFNLQAVSSIEREVGDYTPPWWYNNHLGTCFAFGRDAGLRYDRRFIETEEASLAVDFYPFQPKAETKDGHKIKIILFFPGNTTVLRCTPSPPRCLL